MISLMLIDAHTHLDHPRFDHNRAELIDRARAAGVGLILTVARATPVDDSVSRTLELLARHPELRAAIGVHPHDAASATEPLLERIGAMMLHPGVLLWGEIGLDYSDPALPRQVQRDLFRQQLRMAHEARVPVILHCREAWPDLLSILEQQPKSRGYVHNFTGTANQARECLDLGLLLSFSPLLTSPDASAQMREVAQELRLDEVLVESGTRDEPSAVASVALVLAGAMEVTFEDIVRNTAHNFRRLTGEPAWAEGDVLVYPIRDSLYINLTNRCTAHCVFCRRETSPIASGYNLRLEREHDVEEYLEAIGEPARYAEIVFCGFGEPTLRLDALLEISHALKQKGSRIRLNTNGHGNLIHGRNIAPELASCVDEVSISIDAPDPEGYRKLVRPDFGDGTFEAVIEFAKSCVGVVPRVALTVVDIPTVNLEECRKLARSLNVELREREYQPMVGSTDFR